MHLSFFLGKGGVGKTTVSSAFAVHSALSYPRQSVLLISTDPAHSLADIFELRFPDSPRRIPTHKGKLFAWQINAEKLFECPLWGVADKNNRCSNRGARSRTARVMWLSIAYRCPLDGAA